MKSFFKLGLTALCLGSAVLTACSASQSPDTDKSKLSGAGYTVTVQSAEDYEKTHETVIAVGLRNYLYASKVDSDKKLTGYAAIWYFDTIDQASNFSDSYLATLVKYLEIDGLDFKIGAKNDAVYAMTQDALDATGYGNIF